MSPRSYTTVDFTRGDEVYQFVQLRAECGNADGSDTTIWLPACRNHEATWDHELAACLKCPKPADLPQGIFTPGQQVNSCWAEDGSECRCEVLEQHSDEHGNSWTHHRQVPVERLIDCMGSDHGCISFDPPPTFNPGNLRRYVAPELICTNKSFSVMPSGMSQAMLMPPTDRDPIFHLFRFMHHEGFESIDHVLQNTPWAANVLNAIIFSSIDLQGNTMQVGPTIDEIRQECSVRLNAYLDPQGTAINGNEPISGKDIPIEPLPCAAADILQIKAEVDLHLAQLKTLGETNVACTAARRLDEQDGAVHARRREVAGPLDHSSWAQAIRLLQEVGLRPNRRLQDESPPEWELADGMACQRLHGIKEQLVRNAMSRAFMYSAKDAYGGCKSLLDGWTTTTEVTQWTVTDRCIEPSHDSHGLWNRRWLDDPCCNSLKRAQQCCAPRNVSWTMTAINGINEQSIAEYRAATNTGDLALRLAMQYSQLEYDAATLCFGPFKDFWDSVREPWRIVETCFQALRGSWNDQYQQELGSQCTTNSDCWTDECEAPTPVDGAASTGTSSTKYCKTPINTESQDFMGPVLRCLLKSSPPVLADHFSFAVLDQTGNATIEDGVRGLPGMESFECWGDGWGAWSKATEAECLEQRACNWHRGVSTPEACLHPCSAGDAPCPDFCGRDGMFHEAGHLPMCKVVQHGGAWKMHSQCEEARRGVEMELQHTCQTCKESCRQANHQCQTKCEVCHQNCSLPGNIDQGGAGSSEDPCSMQAAQCHGQCTACQGCKGCAVAACSDFMSNIASEAGLDCLTSTCNCSTSCTHCIAECESQRVACWEQQKPGRRLQDQDACHRSCDAQCELCASHACASDCEASACNWNRAHEAFKSCINVQCAEFQDEEGNPAVVSDAMECIFPHLSYTPEREAACKSECLSAGGPQPAVAKRCYARLKRGSATEDTCHELGMGWIESRSSEDANGGWDWSRGSPPPEFCWVRRYTALDGKPYVPPPPYGPSCPQHCERDLDSCLHSEECYTYLEEFQMTVDGVCQHRFEAFADAFWACEQADHCQGADCMMRKARCMTSTGLEADELFSTLRCHRCHGGWMDWDLRNVQCAGDMPDPTCRWSGDNAVSAPCANDCLHTLCHGLFEECQSQGTSKRQCNSQLTMLNQCRGCHFVQCDAECLEPCREAFAHWGEAEDRCSGCVGTGAAMPENTTDTSYSITSATSTMSTTGGFAATKTIATTTDGSHHTIIDTSSLTTGATTTLSTLEGFGTTTATTITVNITQATSDTPDSHHTTSPPATTATTAGLSTTRDIDSTTGTSDTSIDASDNSTRANANTSARRLKSEPATTQAVYAAHCHPDAPCFGDRACWGETPPFGSSCSRTCERQIESCRNAVFGRCYQWDHETLSNVAMRCSQVFSERYETSFEHCMEQARHAANYNLDERQEFTHSMSCAEQVLPADWPCWECEGHWNRWALWETTLGYQCISGERMWGNNASVSPSCASQCLPTDCPRISPPCHRKLQEALQCFYGPDDLQLCRNDHTTAKAAIAASYPECGNCRQNYCDQTACMQPCDAPEFDRWMSAYERCSGCTSEFACNPSARCFISPVDADAAEYDWSSPGENAAWTRLGHSVSACFPNVLGGRRRLGEGTDNFHRATVTMGTTRHGAPAGRATAKVQTWGGRGSAERQEMHGMQQLQLLSRVARRMEATLGGELSHSAQSEQVRRLGGIRTLQRKLKAALPRHLRAAPTEVSLSCTGSDCTAEEDLCNAFFNRGGEEQDRIDAVVESFAFGSAPWEDEGQICRELGQVCYASFQDLYDALAVSWEGEEWCTRELEETCTSCDGCGTSGPCEHCCLCYNGTAGVSAIVAFEGRDGLARRFNSVQARLLARRDGVSQFEAQNRIQHVHYDDRLFSGRGGFAHHVHVGSFLPKECHGMACWDEWCDPNCREPRVTQSMCADPERFRLFTLSREWHAGSLNTRETCEAESCFPEPWAATEEECHQVSYCQGECPYCETREYWNWQAAQTKTKCQFTDMDNNRLSEDDCRVACGGEFTGTCIYQRNDHTQTSVCLTDPPSDATGETMEERCHEQTVELRDASVTQAKYRQLHCRDFARSDCGWTAAALSDMECEIQRLGCKSRIDCEQAGRCDYQVDEWRIREQGGICVVPHTAPSFTVESGPEGIRHDCQTIEQQLAGVSAEWHNYGCVVFLSGSGSLPSDGRSESVNTTACEQFGGKWWPFAFTASECELPGFAWQQSGSGTHMCCIRWFGSGDHLKCEAFSMDDTQEKCEACAGRWISMFRFRRSGRWIQGRWAKPYEWKKREFTPVNRWIPVVQQHKLGQFFENVVQRVRAVPLKNFIQCRLNPSLESLVGVASQEPHIPKIGDALILPGQVVSQNLGGKIYMETTGSSHTGAGPLSIEFRVDSARNNLVILGDSNDTGTSGDSNDTSAGSRRLESSSPSLTQLTASCYSVVAYNGKTVGQLMGDCVSFQPTPALSGSVQLCLGMDSTIPTNPAFTVHGFALKESASTFIVLTGSVVISGTQLCSNLQNSGTYCPVVRYSDYSSSTVVSADNACPALQTVATTIAEQTEVLQASGFTGSGGMVMLDQPTTTGTPSAPSFTVVVPTTTMTPTATLTQSSGPTALPPLAPTPAPTTAPTTTLTPDPSPGSNPVPALAPTPSSTSAPTAAPWATDNATNTTMPPQTSDTPEPPPSLTSAPTEVPTPAPMHATTSAPAPLTTDGATNTTMSSQTSDPPASPAPAPTEVPTSAPATAPSPAPTTQTIIRGVLTLAVPDVASFASSEVHDSIRQGIAAGLPGVLPSMVQIISVAAVRRLSDERLLSTSITVQYKIIVPGHVTEGLDTATIQGAGSSIEAGINNALGSASLGHLRVSGITVGPPEIEVVELTTTGPASREDEDEVMSAAKTALTAVLVRLVVVTVAFLLYSL